MKPSCDLPLHATWRDDTELYVTSLLNLVTTSEIFRNLCGGVHILDFLTRSPDLYSWVLPRDWREWFEVVDVHDILELLLRTDLECLENYALAKLERFQKYPVPPESLIKYVYSVRIHSLKRDFVRVDGNEILPRHIAVGMKPKKVHEVVNFAAFVDQLEHDGSLIVDFGSGQNYLGRTLACPPYNRHVVAIEQRHHNVQGARSMDISAKLAEKQKSMVNKKEWKKQWEASRSAKISQKAPVSVSIEKPVVPEALVQQVAYPSDTTKGTIQYVEKSLESGDLNDILSSNQPASVVVSIHSCGNLTHHGLRSLTLNSSVTAAAMVGCCYNLLTERLGPPSYKLPSLRSNHPRLESTSSSHDPHGFPVSARLEKYTYRIARKRSQIENHLDEHYAQTDESTSGVRLNITARMMAVQAPYNWGHQDSEDFFTRHFYRALLQKILLDLGVVHMAELSDEATSNGDSLSGKDTAGTPLIIGSLRKSCFDNFEAYVHGALEKLYKDPVDGQRIQELTKRLLSDPDLIERYERQYRYARKHLSVIWSLMAFSAGVVESTILVDRWLWLKEQQEVEQAWVQSVFDYAMSPRNMVVVGVKKKL